MHLNKKLQELKDVPFVLVIFLIIFLAFAGSFYSGVLIWVGLVFAAFIPGLLFVEYVLPDFQMIEKAFIAFFIGIWIIPLILYYLSVLGIALISKLGIAILSLLSFVGLIVLYYKQEKAHEKKEKE